MVENDFLKLAAALRYAAEQCELGAKRINLNANDDRQMERIADLVAIVAQRGVIEGDIREWFANLEQLTYRKMVANGVRTQKEWARLFGVSIFAARQYFYKHGIPLRERDKDE